MIPAPFILFDPFARDLRIMLSEKKDGALTDEQMQTEIGANDTVGLWQEHGGKAIVTRDPVARDIKADAVATDAAMLALTIRTADCQSFLIYAPEHHVACLIHAGWKGLLAGIIPNSFDLLWDEWQIRPEEVYIGAGPSLCQQCSGFTDPRKELPGIPHHFFQNNLVDLRGIAEDQLWKLGVREERFERMENCTKCQNGTWWSYRGTDREAVIKGSTNMLACVLIPR